MRTFIPSDARLIPENAKCVFHGIIFDVYQWEQEQFDGTTKTFEMLKRPDTVQVIAIKDEKIVILEQEQPGTNVFYDLPSGRHDVESETELEAAKRETLEETGMTFKNWKLIQAESPQSKIDWIRYTFLADGFISEVPQKLDSGEKISVDLKTLEEIKELNKDSSVHYLARDIFEGIDSLEELRKLEI